jgi:hypothetical protein
MIGLVIPSLSYLGIVGMFVLLADLPVSVVCYILGWKFPFFAQLWLVVVGTLWWYYLSLAVERLLWRIRANRQ